MSERVDCVVIGAGVVGLAISRALALAGRDVIVLERNGAIGEETSSRNSEVIHAGLYYATDSLKARLCVAGKAMLYAYCEERQVPLRRTGKLIVASAASQRERLESIARQAAVNGVPDCQLIDGRELERREPAVVGAGALWSPSTGIVDSHALMQSLLGDLEAANGMVAFMSCVESIAVDDAGIRLEVRSEEAATELVATTVINSAGLDAVRLASRTAGTPDFVPPLQHLARGNYFIFSGKSPFSTLVYPLPEDGGLGIHATLDLAGSLRFGPDVEWIDTIDYAVDPGRRAQFGKAIRSYWPALRDEELVPGYSGIRPKLSGPGEKAQDFRIEVVAVGTAHQLVHLLGIESPGLTASLAIGDEVVRRIETARG